MSAITRTAHRAVLKLKKNSPKILFAAGMVGMAGTIVFSARAAVKTQPAVQEFKNKIETIEDDTDAHRISLEERKTLILQEYGNFGFEMTKAYAFPVVLGLASAAALTKSHQILTARNAAVTAAYAGLDKLFKEYRQRVVAELGEQKDQEFAYGSTSKDIVAYDEGGNAVIQEKKSIPKDAKSLYGCWFDEGNRNWSKNNGYNYTFLDNQQQWANLQLKSRGHLFLNEVYDLIGMPRTKEGAVVGWIYYGKDESDGYVDMGFHKNPDFVAGFERNVFLDFNVDGVIYDKI